MKLIDILMHMNSLQFEVKPVVTMLNTTYILSMETPTNNDFPTKIKE